MDTGVSQRQALSFKQVRVICGVNTVTEGSSESSSRSGLNNNNPQFTGYHLRFFKCKAGFPNSFFFFPFKTPERSGSEPCLPIPYPRACQWLLNTLHSSDSDRSSNQSLARKQQRNRITNRRKNSPQLEEVDRELNHRIYIHLVLYTLRKKKKDKH